MTCLRDELAAVVCGTYLYAIAGYNGQHQLDSIERIALSDLTNPNPPNNNNNNHWQLLPVRLSCAREGCAAVSLANRYIVVMGGYHSTRGELSSVDLLDTWTTAAWNMSICSGPPLTVPRYACAVAATTIDSNSNIPTITVWVVGGEGPEGVKYDTVESWTWQLDSHNNKEDREKKEDDSHLLRVPYANHQTPWKLHTDSVLSEARSHCCLIAVPPQSAVAGRPASRHEQLFWVVGGWNHQNQEVTLSVECIGVDLVPSSSTTTSTTSDPTRMVVVPRRCESTLFRLAQEEARRVSCGVLCLPWYSTNTPTTVTPTPQRQRQGDGRRVIWEWHVLVVGGFDGRTKVDTVSCIGRSVALTWSSLARFASTTKWKEEDDENQSTTCPLLYYTPQITRHLQRLWCTLVYYHLRTRTTTWSFHHPGSKSPTRMGHS